MERGFAGFQFNGDRILKLVPLVRRKDFFDRVHVSGQAGDRQQIPFVAAGDVLEASVAGCGIVEADPAGQMSHRLSPRPVGIILVPGDDSAVFGRFAEELVMPEPDGVSQQLRGGNAERRMPEQVVEARRNPPGSQSVKEDAVRIGGLVGVILVPEFASVVLRIKQS